MRLVAKRLGSRKSIWGGVSAPVHIGLGKPETVRALERLYSSRSALYPRAVAMGERSGFYRSRKESVNNIERNGVQNVPVYLPHLTGIRLLLQQRIQVIANP
ncbi:MAG: hypothetical protein ACP5PQ_00050 [Thermoproteota archaeon]